MGEENSREWLRKIVPECMVLLKSEGSFPLQCAEPIALYGNGARHTKKGGTGSGDVNVREFLNIETAVKKEGFEITTTDWLDRYDMILEKENQKFRASLRKQIEEEGIAAFLSCMGAVMPEMEYELPLDGAGSTCIYVLSRVSGEGTDREVRKGDFLLTDTEIRDIRKANKIYEKFILILNVGGVVDLSPVADEISNILLLSQAGMQTSEALCDVLLGRSCPSGKLASTWAKWEDYCHQGDFGEKDDIRYREGIYVGYRYFDTVCKTPLFPFGHGLSFTSFQIRTFGLAKEGSKVSVKAEVTNCGKRSGREAVQLYVSVPESRLDQPYQVLAAFEKTEELKPGESQAVSMEFDLRNLASYDEEMSARILEKGRYLFRVGNSSADTEIAGNVFLEEEIIVEKVTPLADQADFKDFCPEKKACRNEEGGADCGQTLRLVGKDFEECKKAPSTRPDGDILSVLNTMNAQELAYLCLGSFQDKGSQSVIGDAGSHVAGAAGETTGRYEDRGIRPIVMADGPAGIRIAPLYGRDEDGIYSMDSGNIEGLAELLPEQMREAFFPSDKKTERKGKIYEQYCSAIPIGTAIAQSFDPGLAKACGELVAAEMKKYGIHLWLAPALNIHRNPLCGRNFEYYSEDPLVSGKMAAAVTTGVQMEKGCGVTIKHFACNNQETNRMRSNSIVSERALRDIYLRGFEIAVKEAAPIAVMTSYNLLNGEHTSSRKDLIKGILKTEWEYEGLVMSDWITSGLGIRSKHKYPLACASGAVRAGNDILMPGGPKDYEDLIHSVAQEQAVYPVSREDLAACAYRVLKTVKRLRQEKITEEGK